MQKILLFSLFVLFPIAILSEDVNQISKINYLHIVSQIQSRFAVTLITSEVANLADSAKEIVFTAQLPDAAFISNFSMEIGNKTIFGDVKEKEKAKEVYDKALRSGQSAGLVAEKPRQTNTFEISVNVAAYDKVVFNLTYQELLKRTYGVYKHVINLQPLQNVEDLQIDVLLNEQGKITNFKVPKFGPKIGEKTNKELLELTEQENVKVTSAFNNDISYAYITYKPERNQNGTSSGQLVVLYDVERDKNGGHIEVMNGYFVHFFAPSGIKRGTKNVIFILDKSGSMIGRKFAQTKDAMKTILKELDKNDTFNILMFSDRNEQWKTKSVLATEDNVKEAILYVQDTEAAGGTNIYDALQTGLNLLTTSEQGSLTSMIIFLTDGEATTGITDNNIIVNNISTLNKNSNYVIHSLAFGNNADFKLVQRISSRNKGLARKVYEDSDADLQLTGFYGEISSPLLTNVDIKYLNETVDVDSLVQDNSYNYYDGGEFVVVGKLTDPSAPNPYFNVDISAKSQSGSISFQSESKDIICPRGYVVIEGDIMVPCCLRRRCPPSRPYPPTKATPPLLPASTIGGFVERMWAYQTIKKLLKASDLETENQEENRRKALQLSLQYKFVTQLTSMVVVQPDQENATILEESKPKPAQIHGHSFHSHSHFPASGSRSGGMYGVPGRQSSYLKYASMRPRPTTTTASEASSQSLKLSTSRSVPCTVSLLTIIVDMVSDEVQCKKNYDFYQKYMQETGTAGLKIDTYFLTSEGVLSSNVSSKEDLMLKCNNGSKATMKNILEKKDFKFDNFPVLFGQGRHSLLFITGRLAVDSQSENSIKNFRTKGGKIYVFSSYSLIDNNVWRNIAGDDEHYFNGTAISEFKQKILQCA